MERRGFVIMSALAGTGAALAAAVAARRSALREDLDWETVDKPGRLVEVDGYRVHVVEAGSGPAIVLVHGFGGHTVSWRRLMPLLARDHRVIAVDLKGFGYSERRADIGLSHGDQARMLRGLLDALGIERAVFVGHSMGGAVVQRFAAIYPERASALVLAASVAGDERYRRAVPPGAVLRPLLPVLAGLAARRLFAMSFYDRSHATPELFEEYLRPARIRGSMDGLLRMMRDTAGDGAIDHARISQPVLLLYGTDDRVVPVGVGQRLRERLPQARLVTVDRAAHLLVDERAEDCERAIRDFLRETGVEHATPVATG
jgi:pimeloyl-ACP methyl ester carboxylesterase